MNMLKLPGIRVLLIATIVTGLFLAPVALAATPVAWSYGIKGPSGATTSVQPAFTTFSAPYALGSVSSYGGVSSRSPSSKLDYFETVSASGKITNFASSFHYEG